MAPLFVNKLEIAHSGSSDRWKDETNRLLSMSNKFKPTFIHAHIQKKYNDATMNETERRKFKHRINWHRVKKRAQREDAAAKGVKNATDENKRREEIECHQCCVVDRDASVERTHILLTSST